MSNHKRLFVAAVSVVVLLVVLVFVGRKAGEVSPRPSSESVVPASEVALAATSAPGVSSVATPAVSSVQVPTARGTLPFVLTSMSVFDKSLLLAVEAMGAKVVESRSRKSVVIEASPAVRTRIAADKRFEKVEELGPSAKIQPALAAFVNDGAKEVEVAIVALAARDREVVLGLLAKNGGALLEGCVNEGGTVRAKLPAEAVAKLAAQGEVRWMERFLRPQLMNDIAVEAPQMNVREVWNTHGLTGAGQNISTSDSGIDTGDLTTMHKDLRNQVKDIQVVSGCISSDTNGHGTHTAGSIVGNGTESSDKIKGTAYEANLYAWFCSKGTKSIYLPTKLDELYSHGGAWTASVHSASWGSAVNGAYNSECADHDRYVWEHPEFLPVFSAGNEGCGRSPYPIYPMTIGSPGSSKNVLTVGATQNAREPGAPDGGWGNGDSTKTVCFSSRGPCQDGRTKPDIAAPGSGILSTRSSRAPATAYYDIYDDFYAYDSGTSMSCPLTAGAVVLTRQWLIEKMGFEDEPGKRPTAALMKAVITGGAKGASVPNNDQGWGRVDLEETLFPSNRAVKLVDRIPFAEGFVTNIVIETTNAAPLDVQLVWVDYPGSASAGQEVSRLVNDLDLIVESTVAGADQMLYGNGGSEPDTLNNVESVRLANAPATKYVITVDCKRILHDHAEGGAAALYIRGAFDPAATPEVPKRVHLRNRNEYFYTLDRALSAVTNDDEFVTILEPEVGFLKSVTLTNSCSVTIGVDSVVRCSRGAGLTASGTGVEVVFSSVSFTNECAGLTASGGATLNASSCNFDGLASLHAEADSRVELLGGRILGDVPSIRAEAGGSVEINYVLIGGDARSLVADGEVSLWCVDIGGSKTEDWSVSGILVLQDTQLGTNQSVSVGADGQLVLADSVKHLSSVNLAEAKRTSLTLASGALITERILVTAPGAYEKGAVFGQYECDYPTAVECGRYLVNALDPEGDLGGLPNSSDGTMRWGIVEAPEAAAGAILKTDEGTKYYYTLKSALRAAADKDAEITLAAESTLTNGVTLAHDLLLTSKNDAKLTMMDRGQFVVPGGTSLTISNLVVQGGDRNLTDCAFKVTGGELTLAKQAVLTGLCDDFALNKNYGGAVVVDPGRFVMTSGSAIRDCRTSNAHGSAVWLSGYKGAAIADLLGGTISGCYTKTADGGAVYAVSKAAVNVGGDFTATENTMGSEGNETKGNLRLAYDTVFTLTNDLSGAVGVSFGKKSGKPDLNAEGAKFIAVADGLDVAGSASGFTHDTDTELVGTDDGAGAIVWKRVIPDGQCEEASAGVRVKVEGESDYRYYRWLNEAFDWVKTNATFETCCSYYSEEDGEWLDDFIEEDVVIEHDVVLTRWVRDGFDNTIVFRDDDAMYCVEPGASLSITNLSVWGATWYSDGYWESDSDVGLISVCGGTLTLDAGADIGHVYGTASRAANAITVWEGGTLTMNSGASVTESYNIYEDVSDATGVGGGILLDGSTAYLKGGEVSGCGASRAGGVYIANKSVAYVSGDFTAKDNSDLDSNVNNLVVGDKSRFVLADEFTGTVGLNEGIACVTDRFGTVEWDWPDAETLARSAKRFQHDVTGAQGIAVTNNVDKRAILVWSDWIAKTGKYVDEDGTEYYPCDPAGPDPVQPTPFSIMISRIGQDRTCELTLVGAVDGCWYKLYATESLEAPVQYTEVTNIHQRATDKFYYKVDTTLKPAKFYKVIGLPGYLE